MHAIIFGVFFPREWVRAKPWIVGESERCRAGSELGEQYQSASGTLSEKYLDEASNMSSNIGREMSGPAIVYAEV